MGEVLCALAPTPEVISLLAKVLTGSPPPHVRDCIFHVLAQHPMVDLRPAVPAVVPYLGHPEPEVREKAAWVLASMGENARGAGPALRNLLAGEIHERTRRMASRALDSVQGILDCRRHSADEEGPWGVIYGEQLLRLERAAPEGPHAFRGPEQDPWTCRVHGKRLEETLAPLEFGLRRYTGEYRQAREEQFPEASDSIDAGCQRGPWDQARVLHCADCRAAKRRYEKRSTLK